MRFGARSTRLRLVMGSVAGCCLAGLAVVAIAPGELHCAAYVQASRVFSLTSIAPGMVEWAVRAGGSPGTHGLLSERMLQFERNDLVEMTVEPGLATGSLVSAGQPVAVVRSLHSQEQLRMLLSQRGAFAARRALLVEGGAPEAVRAAELAQEVAEAELAAERVRLEQVRLLTAAELLANAELEVAVAEEAVQQRRVALARAGVEVARNPARASALDEVDSGIAALDAVIAELERLCREEKMRSPIEGVLELGAQGAELRVSALDPVYLQLPIPVSFRARVAPGAPALFVTTAARGRVFRGRVVEIAESAATAQGRQVFWTSVEVANGDRALRAGMIGSALVPLDGRRPPVGSELRLSIWRLAW